MAKKSRAVGREQREARVADDLCPECGGSLDTGWECNDCGYDAMVLACVPSQIEAAFDRYLKACLGGPDALPAIQVQELRRAFFAGVGHTMDVTSDNDQGVRYRLAHECEEFLRRVRNGDR